MQGWCDHLAATMKQATVNRKSASLSAFHRWAEKPDKWYTVKKYAALAEIEGVTPHTFRRTVATQLVRDPEVDLVTAATFFGHSRLDTTARYSHLARRIQQKQRRD